MKFLYTLPMRVFWPLAVFGIFFILSLFIFEFNYSRMHDRSVSGQLSMTRQDLYQLQGYLNGLLPGENSAGIQKVLDVRETKNFLLYAMIVDSEGRVVFATRQEYVDKPASEILAKERFAYDEIAQKQPKVSVSLSADEKYMFGTFPVVFGISPGRLRPDRIGYYFEVYDFAGINEHIFGMEWMSTGVSALFYFLSLLFFGLIVYMSIIRRITSIIQASRRFADGDLNVRTMVSGNDEIATLAKAVDQMMEKVSGVQKELTLNNIELQYTVNFLNEYMKVIDEAAILSKGDLDGNITYVNDEFCKVTGYTREEVIGSPHRILRDPGNPCSIYEEMWNTIQSKQIWKGIFSNVKKDGTKFYVDATIVPVLNETSQIVEYIALRHDITELIRKREELNRIHRTDSLSGLGNRLKLLDDLMDSPNPALVLYNIDGFQEINDFFGYRIGDEIIVQLGKKLAEYFPLNHFGVYRLTADEYAVLRLNGIPDEAYLKQIHRTLKEIVSHPFKVDMMDVPILLSAGISFERENILTTADMALQEAKKSETNLLIYTKSIDKAHRYEFNLFWTMELQRSLEEDRVVPFFQLILNNNSGVVEKFESLVRIISRDGKVITPDLFLGVAKRIKLHPQLTRVVFDKTCAQFQNANYHFSINLTIADILNRDVIDYMLEKTCDYSGRVVFEIVESEGIDNFSDVSLFIKKAKELGCKIAIDDFGTGYSNFEYMMQLNADYIKIDGSLIKNIDHDKNARLVVETIAQFARKMGIQTIAEFVHSADVYRIVQEMGIDYSQGFYLGRPVQNPEGVNALLQ